MTPKPHPDTDLETCSALFDGELQGDAARFALKRLGHDARWRQACGNWQLLGDVLRGQATAVAPHDFADRVAAAIAVERAHVIEPAQQEAMTVTPTATVSASRRSWNPKWVGGVALAASVALVALFVARPLSPGSTPGSTPTMPATQMAAATPAAPAVESPARTDLTIPATPDSTTGLATAAVAVAEVPRRAAERRSRGQSQRAALRVSKRRIEAPIVAAASNAAVVVNEPATPAATSNPFHPQPAEVATRPWPRAVLPNYPASGALTASFGSSSASSPSFYPFEPRLPAGEGSSDPVINADGPRP